MKIFITGKPGVGKTTLLEQIISKLALKNMMGCVVKEQRDNGQRTGFHIQYTPAQPATLLALKNIHISDHYVSKYSVNIDGIEHEMLPFMEKMLMTEDVPLLFFDEIGRMQNKSPLFLPMLNHLLEKSTSFLATILYDDEEWTLPFKHNPHYFFITVTEENRDMVGDQIISLFHQSIS
ncbi:MAG: nucleoside-triphosphatase [Alphaproteobacteria bacterium]|nr:nucleoside-triphosphatase [Alphaproteobacteria bacterium]